MTAEQLTLVMAFDGREAERGLNAMLARNAENAAKTRAIWAEADRAMEADYRHSIEEMIAEDKAKVVAAEKLAAEQLAIEKALDKAKLETHAANQASLLKVTAARLAEETAAAKAQAVANAEIAAGSGMFGAAEAAVGGAVGAVAGGYVFNEAGKLISAGGKAVKELETAGKEAHGLGAMLRETAVIFREFMRGNYTRMIGSVTRLIEFAGAAVGALAVPFFSVLAGTAIITGPSAWRAYKARKAAAQSDKDVAEKDKYEGELLKKRVEDLHRAGLITDQQATAYQEQIHNGQNAQVAIATDPLLKNGTAGEQVKKAEEAREVARIQNEAAKAQDEANMENEKPQEKYNSHLLQRMQLERDMNGMRRDSVDYAKAEVEYARLTKEIGEDLKNLEKEKADAAQKKKEHDREALEIQKQYNQNANELVRKQAEIDNIGFAAPTIAQLAGRGYSARLGRAYGRGGRYDLENGRGPFGHLAREAELAEKQQMWDLIHGNASFTDITDDKGRVIGQKLTGGAAYDDLQRRTFAENRLKAAGLDTPAMKQNRMMESLDSINTNISDLKARAAGDGININTGE
jgi:hypothetical protein